MKTRKQRIVVVIAILLALLMIAPMLISFFGLLVPSAAAITQSDIDKLKKNLNAITEEKKNLKNEIAALKSDKEAVMRLIQAYDKEIELNAQAIEESNALISHLNASIAAQQLELEDAIAKEKESEERFIRRLRAMDRMEQVSVLGVLLEAQNFSDLLTRLDDFTEIMRFDQKIIEDLRTIRQEIDSRREALDIEKQDLNITRKELAAAEVELASLIREQQSMYSELGATEAENNLLLKKMDEEEEAGRKAVDAAIAKKIKEEEEAKKQKEYVGGEMKWPVPGYTYISSPYGMRVHPVYKVNRMHTGIDIPAPRNTPVVAANSGTILISAYASGYGNYVVVNHGGGKTTLYAHLSKSAGHAVGASVKKGDTIGYIGSTGTSTGNHLHFEVRTNGAHTDPMPFVKGK